MIFLRFVIKIVGGKLVIVLDYRGLLLLRQSGFSVIYLWGKYDFSLIFKIGGIFYFVFLFIFEGK